MGMGSMLGHFHGAIKPGIEPSLEKQMIVTNWDLPTRQEIEEVIRYQVQHSDDKDISVEYSDEDFYKISRALQGLTIFEIENAISLCGVAIKKLDPKFLLGQKKQIIARSEVLEY